MTAEIEFYTHPMSRGRIVRWMLEEVGQPYTTHVIDYGPPMKAAAYRAINPMGKVPAIRHRGQVVTECAAICAYLADAFPAANLAPSVTDARRAPYHRWMYFAAGPLEAALINAALKVIVPDERRGMVGYGSLDDVMATLEQHLAANAYVTGDSFTAADVYVGSHIGFGMQFGGIEKRPAFVAYHERLSARAASIRAKSLDDALAPLHPIPGRG